MKTYSVMILKADDSPAEIHHIKGTGGPAFDKIYPLINASMIAIAEGRWHLFKNKYGAQMPDPRLAGDVAVVFPPRIQLDANWTPAFQGQPLVHAEDAAIFAAADKVASIID